MMSVSRASRAQGFTVIILHLMCIETAVGGLPAERQIPFATATQQLRSMVHLSANFTSALAAKPHSRRDRDSIRPPAALVACNSQTG
ncbi:hypothetical protein [Bradyrhizobium sp. STM 3557]|uniref:hypothetical protein n=1 Tax=Bradyrhizobium sp. STM 3557 TaxID=578920 RepID=UPI003890DF48